MVELARAAKFELPTTDPDALRRFMLVDDAGNLEDYLARFEYTIPLLQTPEGIERVSYEMVEDAARDGLRYLEVRYCPELSTRGGLTWSRCSTRSCWDSREVRARLRRGNAGDQLLPPALQPRGLGRDRTAVRRAIVTAASWRSTWRAARRAGLRAATRLLSTWRSRDISA